MLWLSALADTQECPIYFEIRDIEVRQTGSEAQGVVRGLLGDGRRELWSEVFLGATPSVQILSEWSETGGVEGFDAAIDEAMLKQQLLAGVETLFARIGRMASCESPADAFFAQQPTATEYSCLVA